MSSWRTVLSWEDLTERELGNGLMVGDRVRIIASKRQLLLAGCVEDEIDNIRLGDWVVHSLDYDTPYVITDGRDISSSGTVELYDRSERMGELHNYLYMPLIDWKEWIQII